MYTMNSKYSGTCKRCGGWFPAGTKITWSKESGSAHATVCPAAVKPVAFQKELPVAAVAEKLVPGVYETAGEVYVVKYNREKTNLYAKKLVVVGDGVARLTEAGSTVTAIEFEYAPGAIRNIKLVDRMPIARAKELVTLYGRCIACGRNLKAATSVENGIGPVCIKNFGPVIETVPVVTVDGRHQQIARVA